MCCRIAGLLKHEVQAGAHAVKHAEEAVMPSWFTSKLACTGGFGSKEKDTAHATGDASLQVTASPASEHCSEKCTADPPHVQNGRVGGGLDVPVLEHESQTEREAEEADEVEDGVSLAEAESGVSLTYKVLRCSLQPATVHAQQQLSLVPVAGCHPRWRPPA